LKTSHLEETRALAKKEWSEWKWLTTRLLPTWNTKIICTKK
jgi:hypothetical protein